MTLILWGDEVEELDSLASNVRQMAHVIVVSELLWKRDVLALYEEADYFMTDAYCMRVLEAMAMEVPVIAPASDEMLAVASESEAFLLPCTIDSGACKTSFATYADALRNLERFEVDAQLRAADGAIRAAAFAANVVAKRVAERIHSLLGTIFV